MAAKCNGGNYLTSSPANSNTLVMVTFSFWPVFCNSVFSAEASFSFPLVMADFEWFTEPPVSFKKSKMEVHYCK